MICVKVSQVFVRITSKQAESLLGLIFPLMAAGAPCKNGPWIKELETYSDPSICESCPFSPKAETITQVFAQCTRLETLFNVLTEWLFAD